MVSVKNAAGWFDDLSVTRRPQFRRITAALWKFSQLLDVAEDTLNKCRRCSGIVESDEISDSIQIIQRWIGPDYFNHRAR